MPLGAANGLAPCHTRITIRGDWKAHLMGIEEHVAVRCPCCNAADVGTGHARTHARTCLRAEARQVNQHQPLLHARQTTWDSSPG